jgi:GntR family transcriptional regulator
MKDWQDIIKIDKQAKVPLYHQINQNLRQLIEGGHLQPGDGVPSEWELSDLYGVSRLTVRRALEELAREGWLTRRHGVGTFVANTKVAQIVPSKLGFTQKMQEIGRLPSSRLISLKVILSPAEVAIHLGLEAGAPVIELVRVRLADDEPIMLETSYLSQARFPDLTEAGLGNHSLYEFLSQHYHTTLVAVDQTLEPTLLTVLEAELLEAEPQSPAMLSEVLAFTTEDTAIEYSRAVTRADKCKFIFHFREGETVKQAGSLNPDR